MAVESTPLAGARVEAKSSHVEDAALQPFLQLRFDPVDYLNTTLPALTFAMQPRDVQSTRVSLSELSAQTQTLMSQLNAQTSRLTNTLNQLTDDILRSGGRLAYEVEILRGETVGLSDALNEGLREDINHFVPEGSAASRIQSPEIAPDISSDQAPRTTLEISTQASSEPEYIEKLRTLTSVRARLESVIKVFGEAMQWPVAPSELSMASSIISVSAPSSGGPEESRNREEKAKEYAQNLRNEISDLLQGAASAEEGIDAAIKRIEELRDVSSVWKGTAEEKARTRQIDNLMKPVDEEQKALAKRAEARRRTASPGAGVDYRYGQTTESTRATTQGGYGFIRNLQKIKDDIYLD
ncbi:hypothetical protein MBLNU459_g7261t1 [Dothideomycetes sp. NU459]